MLARRFVLCLIVALAGTVGSVNAQLTPESRESLVEMVQGAKADLEVVVNSEECICASLLSTILARLAIQMLMN